MQTKMILNTDLVPLGKKKQKHPCHELRKEQGEIKK